MNIFHLDKNPIKCAEYHCDKHVVKMILETAQMLSTAYQKYAGENDSLYKSAYHSHPMTLWVGETYKNFGWTLLLGESLGFQYTHRYNKRHKSMRIVNYLIGKINYLKESRHHHHYVCPMNLNVMTMYNHTKIIILIRKKVLQSIQIYQHQSLCYENKRT